MFSSRKEHYTNTQHGKRFTELLAPLLEPVLLKPFQGV